LEEVAALVEVLLMVATVVELVEETTPATEEEQALRSTTRNQEPRLLKEPVVVVVLVVVEAMGAVQSTTLVATEGLEDRRTAGLVALEVVEQAPMATARKEARLVGELEEQALTSEAPMVS
jgi:hypothetical protein